MPRLTETESPAASARLRDMSAILAPRSVAVIGASRDLTSVGGAIVRNLLVGGFTGAVYPVNPQAPAVAGMKCYHAVAEIPDPVDLAVIIVKASLVPSIVDQCAQHGVRGVVVISAGFREVGGGGEALERQLREVIDRRGLTVVGPNCLGVLNTDPAIQLNATFAKEMPAAGPIAFVSQSGALCTAVLEYARHEGIGFSKVVSLGNKVNVNELDILWALRDDPQTKVILLYLEDLADGARFIEIAREITGEGPNRKPILAVKAGRTPEGRKAASSHTGALAGSDEAYDAIFAQAGVLRVESVEELFDYASAFAYQPLPRGRRVAIVTNAGGPGIMTTDACVRYGLELAALETKTVEAIRPHVPPTAALNNPIDVIGDAREDRYDAALRAVVEDPNVDSVIALATPQAMTDLGAIGRVVGRVASASHKPVVACFMGVADVTAGVAVLDQERVPHYRFPESAVRALAAMSRYTEWVARPRTVVKTFPVDRPAAERILATARAAGRRALSQIESLTLLQTYGFPMPAFGTARTAAEAQQLLERLGGPVAMKILSADILHKVDVGGVRLGVATPADAERVFRELQQAVAARRPDAVLDGVVMQRMLSPGTETILGMNRDPQFGALLMFGLGGIFVEATRDVTFRLAPIRELGAQLMVSSIRAHKILEGFRGQPPADLACVRECLERLSQLVVDHPTIAELDINPLIVYPQGQGAQVADARVLLTAP